MTHELFKLTNGGFKVKSSKLDRVQFFVNIESASETLESLGVISDEIDVALVYMANFEHNYANFNTKDGMFVFSDNVDAPEQVV